MHRLKRGPNVTHLFSCQCSDNSYLIPSCERRKFSQELSDVHQHIVALHLHRKHIHLRPLRRLRDTG
jgi:hypothetical protein